MEFIEDKAIKGRGAVTNRAGRYEPADRIREADGWQQAGEAPEPEPRDTVVSFDSSRTIITRNQSPDIFFDQSLNAYRGCEHGCIYCFARPTHAYLGLSPGLDFETRLTVKRDAAVLLRGELSRPTYRPTILALGMNTDPYQPIERTYRITRAVLEVLSEFNHPVAITTKSARILEDIDLLADMARRNLASVYISVTTLDPALARVMEPRASTPENRLRAIAALRHAGIPAGISIAPIIPAINDGEIEHILERAAAIDASGAFWTLIRLALELKDLFEEWLDAHFPDRKSKVLELIRQCHGGQIYRSAFGARMRGSGPYAEMLRQRFQKAARRLGLAERTVALDVSRFAIPPRAGQQLNLF
ncbi:MAG TPA: PA0069 family radical SAM protein [Dongiaceae bacterium]|nr:PA0069 family radical SAM protein [Dongiaceae bacterium]